MMFRAFLNYNGKEIENMGIDEYLKATIILDDVLKLWHAPYLKHE
jgi:hypothetical protein